MTSTRIEIYDPKNIEKPLGALTVPGLVDAKQVRKSLKISVVLKVDTGGKLKKKSIPISIYDEELKKKIEEYIDSLIVRFSKLEVNEEPLQEVKLGQIKTTE